MNTNKVLNFILCGFFVIMLSTNTYAQCCNVEVEKDYPNESAFTPREISFIEGDLNRPVSFYFMNFRNLKTQKEVTVLRMNFARKPELFGNDSETMFVPKKMLARCKTDREVTVDLVRLNSTIKAVKNVNGYDSYNVDFILDERAKSMFRNKKIINIDFFDGDQELYLDGYPNDYPGERIANSQEFLKKMYDQYACIRKFMF